MMRILCVCLGNICRSPLAEAVIRAKAEAVGRDLDVASAAIENWHVGEPPDPRSVTAAGRRGYTIPDRRSRQITTPDFAGFDLMLAMDASNVEALRSMAPAASRAQIRLFHHAGLEILDPYYEAPAVFEDILDMIEHAADALMVSLRP